MKGNNEAGIDQQTGAELFPKSRDELRAMIRGDHSGKPVKSENLADEWSGELFSSDLEPGRPEATREKGYTYMQH